MNRRELLSLLAAATAGAVSNTVRLRAASVQFRTYLAGLNVYAASDRTATVYMAKSATHDPLLYLRRDEIVSDPIPVGGVDVGHGIISYSLKGYRLSFGQGQLVGKAKLISKDNAKKEKQEPVGDWSDLGWLPRVKDLHNGMSLKSDDQSSKLCAAVIELGSGLLTGYPPCDAMQGWWSFKSKNGASKYKGGRRLTGSAHFQTGRSNGLLVLLLDPLDMQNGPKAKALLIGKGSLGEPAIGIGHHRILKLGEAPDPHGHAAEHFNQLFELFDGAPKEDDRLLPDFVGEQPKAEESRVPLLMPEELSERIDGSEACPPLSIEL